MTETKTQETNRTVQTQPIAIKMHYICDSDYVSKINKYAAFLIAVMTAAFVLTGTHSCQSISDLAVYLSWLVYFVPLLFAWIGIATSMKITDEMTVKQHKNGPARLCRCGVFGALFAGVTVFSCIYFMITGEYDQISAEIGMTFLGILECASSAGVAVLSRKLLSQVEEVPVMEEIEQ